MAGTIIRVNWKEHARPTATIYFSDIETGFADLEEAMIAIDCDQLIAGTVLWSRRSDEQGVRIVRDRQAIAFRGGAIDRVELPRVRFVDEAS